MHTVTLHSAFTWLCPDCKRRNYVKGLPVEGVVLDETFEPPEEGEYVMIPEEVVCKKCGEHYSTEDDL